MSKLLRRIKERFSKYLAKLEKANEESFGNGRPDCCSMNRGNKEAGGGPGARGCD